MNSPLMTILHVLWAESGRPERAGDDDVLGVVVRMMLAQATSKANAARAFGELVDRFCGDWESVAHASVDDVAGAIEIGGLSRQKAPRIQALLRAVCRDFGEYSLDELRTWDPVDALEYLTGFDGVGPTTATFALMDAAGMDLFPINGGIRRMLVRLGLLEPSASDADAHAVAREMLLPGDAYAAHMALVRHARTICVARVPKCERCAVAASCASARME